MYDPPSAPAGEPEIASKFVAVIEQSIPDLVNEVRRDSGDDAFLLINLPEGFPLDGRIHLLEVRISTVSYLLSRPNPPDRVREMLRLVSEHCGAGEVPIMMLVGDNRTYVRSISATSRITAPGGSA